MQFDGIDVSKFKYLMWTLVSRAGDPKMTTLVQHTAKKASFDERMAIVKGINYIAEPCARVLDFRIYFYELCQAHEFEGVQHFLDPESIQVFDALIEKTGGRYTVGVYDELTSYAKRKAEEFQRSQPQQTVEVEPKLVCLDRKRHSGLSGYSESRDVSKSDVSKQRLVESIEQRIFEAHYVNAQKGVSYTLADAPMNYQPLTEFVIEDNREFWQYIQLDEDFSLVHAIVHKAEIKAVLAQSQPVSKYYLAKKLNVNDQLDFALIEFASLPEVSQNDPALFASLLMDDVKLLRIDIVTEQLAERFSSPSLLRSENNVRLQTINQRLSPELKRLAANSEKLLTISDDTHILSQLKLLQPHCDPKLDKTALPNSLVQYLVRPRQKPEKLQQAIMNSVERRKEERFACNTTCILVDKAHRQGHVGKTLDLSTKGLAVKFNEAVELALHDEVFISLPSVNKRMLRQVKNQAYRIVHIDDKQVRLKISADAKQRDGERLLVDFLARYQGQLSPSGKTESLTGLTQCLRSLVSSCHRGIPFTYAIAKRSCVVEFISTNPHSRLSNLTHDVEESELKRLLSSEAFSDYIKQLYQRLLEGKEGVTGYLLLLPRWQDKKGREHLFWIQDLMELAQKKTGFEFLHKLSGIAKPSVLSVSLTKPKFLDDRYFCDELTHLNRIDPISADDLPTKAEDIVALGEIKEITDLFVSFVQDKEDIVMVEASQADV